MKLCVLIIFTLLLSAACSNAVGDNAPSTNNKAANGNVGKAELSEKNKQIALKNEVVKATEAAQMLEKQGRQMESYRLGADAESARQCKVVAEDLQRQTTDWEAKVKSFPESFGTHLTPVTSDLKACVSCSKTAAMPACVRARASLNKAIKEIFAQ